MTSGAGNGRSLRATDPVRADRIPGTPEQVATPMPSVAAGWDQPADLTKAPATIPDPAEVEVPEALRREIEGHMANYPDRHSAALPALEAAQRVHGYCSPLALAQVAAVMRVTPAYLSSVVTFYDMLNSEPVGRSYVYVCTSVSCHMRRAQRLADAMKDAVREDDDINVREFECLGACDMAPMASINGRYVGPIDPSEAPEVIAAVREGRTPLPGRGLGDEGFRLPWEGER